MKYDLDRWIFFIPLQDVQNPEVNNITDCVCLLCGKKIKGEAKMVHLLTDGNLVSTKEDFDNSQGFFEIGSECKNKIPNNFYW